MSLDLNINPTSDQNALSELLAPEISVESRVVLDELNIAPPKLRDNKQEALQKDLKREIIYLQKSSVKIEQIKETPLWKNRRNGMIRMALVIGTVALIALSITGLIVSGGGLLVGVGFVVGLLAYIIVSVEVMYHSSHNIDELEKLLPSYKGAWYSNTFDDASIHQKATVGILGGNLVMPLFEMGTRKARIERVSRAITTTLKTKKAEYEEEIKKNRKEFENFYSDHRAIKNMIKLLEGRIDNLKSENEQSIRLKQIEKATCEFKRAVKFYSRSTH